MLTAEMTRTIPAPRPSRTNVAPSLPAPSTIPANSPAVTPLQELEANSHRPEVQALIREGIRQGRIRARPWAGNNARVRLAWAVSPASPNPIP